MKTTLYTIIVLLVIWSLYGYFSSHVEQAEYVVLKKADGYEIRNYPPHIVAQTTVLGGYNDSMSEGFTIVAGYIFGGNLTKESIAMTSPVVVKENTSKKIPMTTPVILSGKEGERTLSFVMPKSYTMSTLPTPTDSRVKIVEVPEKKFAVIRFSGYRTIGRIEKMEKKLLEVLTKDGVETIGTPAYAGYNAPGTPPWMTRNEVLIEVK